MKDKSSNEIRTAANFAVVKTAQDGKLTAVASNPTLDRDGEIIVPSAFLKDLGRYRANPVILAAHTHRSMDGTPTIIGRADMVRVENNALIFEMTFAETPVAQQWQSLYEGGFAKAFSVGFLGKEGAYDKARQGFTWTRVELLEISAVPVPSNPESLRLRDAGGNLVYREPPAAPVPAVDRERLAVSIEDLGQDFPGSKDIFGQLAGALRSGKLDPSHGLDLLAKARRGREAGGEAGERALLAAIEKLAGGLERRGPVPCPAVDW
jgi:HK97 family phage prohead protease